MNVSYPLHVLPKANLKLDRGCQFRVYSLLKLLLADTGIDSPYACS